MTVKRQLDKFLAKYEPGMAANAKKAPAKMRKLAPGAVEMVYDNYNWLVIGFAPNEKASLVVFSIVMPPPMGDTVFLAGSDTAGSGEAVERTREPVTQRETAAAVGAG